MKRRSMTSGKGFTLIEVMVAIGLSMVILGAATTLFSNSVNVSNKALSQIEMQQGVRSALNAASRDISIAGVGGFPRGGIPLPTGGTTPAVKFACDQTAACPGFTPGGGAYTNSTLYPINVFNAVGATALGQKTDVIVTASVDGTFCSGTVVTTNVTVPASPVIILPSTVPAGCTSGTLAALPGDIFMLYNGSGGVVAGEVTAVDSTKTRLTFGPDATILNLNQSGAGATANTIPLLVAAGGVISVNRIGVVTYYLSFTAPTLMRQVNGNTAVPVAEFIENLQFSYDLYTTDTAGNQVITTGATSLNTAATPPQDSTQIRKVNIVMGGRSRFVDTSGQYRRVSLATFVSPRSLSFYDRYAN